MEKSHSKKSDKTKENAAKTESHEHKIKGNKTKNNSFLGLRQQWSIFLSSFKHMNLRHSWAILFNMLFFLATYGIVFLWSYSTNRYANKIGLPADYATLAPAQIQSYSAQMQTLYSFIVSTAVILVLLLVIFWSFFEGLAWLSVYQKKPTWKIFRDFTGFNILWFVIWALPLAGILAYTSKVYNPSIAIYGTAIWIIVVFYFTIIAYAKFFESAGEVSIGEVLKRSFLTGVKVHLLFVPICFGALVFITLTFVDWLISFLPKIAYQVLSFIFFLIVYTWVRIYVIGVTEKI